MMFDDYEVESIYDDYRREAYGDPCPHCGELRYGGDCPSCNARDESAAIDFELREAELMEREGRRW